MRNMLFKRPTELSEADLLELLRIKQEARKKIPSPVMAPDFSDLIKTVDVVLQDAVKEGHMDSNAKHWIFESVMTTIYGPDFFKWYNNSGICR